MREKRCFPDSIPDTQRSIPVMYLIDYTVNSPQENIALDELLLLKAEAGEIGECLRFWEAREYFVVLGRAGKVEEECLVDGCRKAGIPIIRRVSGGGTVLQGPGCLNYSLILSYSSESAYRDINGSYRAVLEKICRELSSKGIVAEFKPICDVAVAGKKVSGNAQARKKKYFLQHGTFLHDFDIGRINACLKHPPKEPEYRKGRNHADFIANIPLSAEDLKECVTRAFPVLQGDQTLDKAYLAELSGLIDTKYAQDLWNKVF